MTRTDPRAARQSGAGRLAAVLGLLALAAGLLVGLPDPVLARDTGPVDFRLSESQCELLGRAWTAGACSRTTCAARADHVDAGRNAEVCEHGRHGSSYGQPIDLRTCGALHRVWVAQVNWCASDPHRAAASVLDSPWCQAPWTTYVMHAEVPGAYDQCLRPRRARQLQRLADHESITLDQLTLARSRVLCDERPGAVYLAGRCEPVPPGSAPPPGGQVVEIGDSVAWRSDDDLAAVRPDWKLDALPGRAVDALGERLALSQALSGPPSGVVIAVGANPSADFHRADLDALVAGLAPSTTVLFVLPYRADPSARVLTDRYGGWMRELAATRAATCVAPWSDLVTAHPHLLVDDVHPTGKGERVWAAMVSSAWEACTTG